MHTAQQIAEDRILRLEQQLQEVTEKAAANTPQETYQEKKQALEKTYHGQLEQLESQREVEPAAKPTEPEHSPRNKKDNKTEPEFNTPPPISN
jgi:hypothetical protein